MPGKYLVKRLVALEGDWLYVPGRVDAEKIPKVPCTKPRCVCLAFPARKCPKMPCTAIEFANTPNFSCLPLERWHVELSEREALLSELSLLSLSSA